MKLNLRLMQAFQFFQQFKLDICHKLGKKHIIPNALNQLTSANTRHPDLQHSELNALFTYNAILVEIYPSQVSQILARYKINLW